MADPQDRSEKVPDAVKPPPAKAAKKAAAKKPAKKAPAKASKKAAAKKAPAKKAPTKKAPTKKDEATGKGPQPGLANTNGAGELTSAAKEAAAQAKSTVDAASNPVPPTTQLPVPESSRSPVPLAVALAVSLLAVFLIRKLIRHIDDEA